MTPVYFDPAESLAHQLREAGYAEGDIQALIVSHFHADHIAGLQDFSHLDFICSGEGWQQTRGLRGFAALKRAFIPGLIPADFESRLQFMEAFPRWRCPRCWRRSIAVTRCRAAKGRLSWCRCRGMRPAISAPLSSPTPAGRCWPATPPGRRRATRRCAGLRAWPIW